MLQMITFASGWTEPQATQNLTSIAIAAETSQLQLLILHVRVVEL